MRPTKHLGGTATFGRGTVGSSCDPSCGGAFKDQRIRLGKEADNVRPLHLPFARWPEEIVRYLKGSGAPFAHFVFRAFHCCRGDRHDAPKSVARLWLDEEGKERIQTRSLPR